MVGNEKYTYEHGFFISQLRRAIETVYLFHTGVKVVSADPTTYLSNKLVIYFFRADDMGEKIYTLLDDSQGGSNRAFLRCSSPTK